MPLVIWLSNVTRMENLGVTSIGGGGCEPCQQDASRYGAPCGEQCLGDESTTETEYVEPGPDTNGRWINSAPYRQRTYGRDSDLVSEMLTYYDGADFEGLTLGQLDQGKATRSTVTRDANTTITLTRNAFDEHGNVIDTLDPLGSPDGHTHRRQYTYDDEGLRVTQADILLEDSEGNPYTLRRQVRYEPLFDKIAEGTAWMRVVDGQLVSTRRATSYTYDVFGRTVARYLPGNISDDPDDVYEYDLQSPASRIITRSRSQVGGPLDLESIQCIDGRNRTYQTRTRLDTNLYQVTGFTVFNVRSSPVQVYQPYTSASDGCDPNPPEGTLPTRYRYDALGRIVATTLPDASIYGEASVLSTGYEPLVSLSYDAEDNDPSSPHYNTPTVTRTNGIGRTVAIERYLAPEGPIAALTMEYDSLGFLTHVTDPEGNVKVQEYDRLGRVLRVIDPNSANETTMEYDDASNVVRQTDDRGITTIMEYDGLNRLVLEYDETDPAGTQIQTFFDAAPDCPAQVCSNTEGFLAMVTYPDGEQRGVHQMGYDLRGRSMLVAHVLDGYRFEFQTVYDNADRVVSTTWPNGQTIERAYDDASRLSSIEGLVPSITYDERNLVSEVVCADGSSTTSRYDDLMRLSQLVTADTSQHLQHLTYQRDLQNNLIANEDWLMAGPSFEAARFGYGPDQSRVSRFDRDGQVLYPFKTFEVRDGVATLYVKMGRHRMVRLEDPGFAVDILGDPIADREVNAADAWASD
ncbi:MAG: hypothetical protein AAFX99_30150, partial [Myxococcota bacterium]